MYGKKCLNSYIIMPGKLKKNSQKKKFLFPFIKYKYYKYLKIHYGKGRYR